MEGIEGCEWGESVIRKTNIWDVGKKATFLGEQNFWKEVISIRNWSWEEEKEETLKDASSQLPVGGSAEYLEVLIKF